MSRLPAMLVATTAVLATLGCTTRHTAREAATGSPIALSPGHRPDAGSPVLGAASLTPTQGQDVRGLVLLREIDGTHVQVHARVTGLKPDSEHGFHVHEHGHCASHDGNSAGGHFNPARSAHGPQHAEHHAGDMPSLKADANGVADQTFVLRGVSLSPGAHSLDNRAVIVHADPDDFKTQPTGNAGARVACGVIAIQ